MTIIQTRLAKPLQRPIWLLALLSLFSFSVYAQQIQEEQVQEEQIHEEQTPIESELASDLSSEVESAGVNVPDEQVSLSVEQLKKQVIKLNRDLFILEEDLLFPANTQLVVYVSFSTGTFINLDSITLKVDDEVVAAHLYTERQLEALKRGGMQRLYMGNLKTGDHEITAILHGIGPNRSDYKLAASKVIDKGTEITALEIRIEDQSSTYQPRVSVIEWED